MMKKLDSNRKPNGNFYENINPIKLTECRRLDLNVECWGLLTDYILESVKVNRYKQNLVLSTAVLQVADRSGRVTCIVKGKSVGLLFGLSGKEWSDIEEMCSCGQQLFYRYFKDGLSRNFSCEQKLFYNFCSSNQKEDLLIAIFKRIKNTRNKDNNDPLINILQLTKANSPVLDLYINHLEILNKM